MGRDPGPTTARRGLVRRASRIQIALQHDLRGKLITPRFPLLPREPRGEQALLGFDARVALVVIDDRTTDHRGQPLPEPASPRR